MGEGEGAGEAVERAWGVTDKRELLMLREVVEEERSMEGRFAEEGMREWDWVKVGPEEEGRRAGGWRNAKEKGEIWVEGGRGVVQG